MFCLEIDDLVAVPVSGFFNDAKGSKKFAFTLTCKRMDNDSLSELMAEETKITDFIVQVTTGWNDVRDKAGAPVPFEESALRQLLALPNLPALCFTAYADARGAKEKN